MSISQPPAQQIATELGLRPAQVQSVLKLIEEGNTIPFIARYRKEATGELDEVQIRDIRDRAEYIRELEERRATVLSTIAEQGQLTDDLRARIEAAATKVELEDLYRPYRPKRRTRATIAMARGLGPLADALREGRLGEADLRRRATAFIDPAGEVPTIDDALAGARDMVAERISDDPQTRAMIRKLTFERGELESRAARGKESETSKFQDYYAFSQPLRTIPGHRVLAIRRGEAEDYLQVSVTAPEEEIHQRLRLRYCSRHAAADQMWLAVEDAYRRLIAPSVEVELRMELKNAADEEAIRIFGQNLEALLLSPPAGGKRTLGIDPGYRTGCKLAVVSATGAVLETGVVYLHQEERARAKILSLVEQYELELIAIGNGTASRETDRLVRDALKSLPPERRPIAFMVSEAGASVYSASDLARDELPDLDLTLRSAVSIARRMQDPLAELVKIDPKSIGVGQYQHDVPQPKLKRRLDETVESCVNRVGVEVNTASPALLGYVSGIGAGLARKIVEHRDARGRFRSRAQLLEVPGLGARTFQQSAGFLRVRESENPLDASAVHPERYDIVEKMGRDIGLPVAGLVGDEAAVARIDTARYVGDEIGLPTLQDIIAELIKPGRDPRQAFEAPGFREDVQTIEDLREGMTLEGTVTNVVAFGAFVDIGVHQDGLVHISRIADRYVKDPNDVVTVGQRVTVTVVEVDLRRKRIALSMRQPDSQPRR